MSTCVTLHLQTQVASIMEVLANSAVVEISKAIDEGTAVLLLEMSRSRKENETLKWRLLELEKELLEARRGGDNRATPRDRIRSVEVQVGDEIRGPDSNSYEEERSLSIDSVFGKEWSISLWKDGEPKKEEEAPLQPVINEEATQTVEDRQDLFPIKMELFEENLEDSDPQGGLKISGGVEPERDSTERRYGEESDPQPASPGVTEEPYTRPTAAGGRLEQHTLPVTMEGTAEPHTPPAPPESTAGPADARQYFLRDKKTNAAKRAGRKRLACTRCGRKFSYFSSVQKHQQMCSHCGEEPYKCINCGNSFSQEVHLRLHQCSHRREKPSSCLKSGENSSQKSEFESQRHIYQGHFYSSATPHKIFPNINMFNQHLSNRTGKKLHRCLVCGKCFSQRGGLHLHQRTVHTGEKPYSCAECGKTFSHNGNLQKHQVIHTGEKSYSCAECGKNFSQKGNLRRHQIIHTGEKPYQCLECGKRFTDKGYLKKHNLIHRGVKPHRCRECGKCFSQKSNRNSHERIHRREATLVL